MIWWCVAMWIYCTVFIEFLLFWQWSSSSPATERQGRSWCCLRRWRLRAPAMICRHKGASLLQHDQLALSIKGRTINEMKKSDPEIRIYCFDIKMDSDDTNVYSEMCFWFILFLCVLLVIAIADLPMHGRNCSNRLFLLSKILPTPFSPVWNPQIMTYTHTSLNCSRLAMICTSIPRHIKPVAVHGQFCLFILYQC